MPTGQCQRLRRREGRSPRVLCAVVVVVVFLFECWRSRKEKKKKKMMIGKKSHGWPLKKKKKVAGDREREAAQLVGQALRTRRTRSSNLVAEN